MSQTSSGFSAKKAPFIAALLAGLLHLFTQPAAAQDPTPPDYKNLALPFEQRVADLIKRMTLSEKASQTLMASPAIPRLGVPACQWWTEGAHGLGRAGVATVFPDPIAMAASWNPALLNRIAEATADEARAKFDPSGGQYRGIIIWSPTINMARDPRWGRTEETYSEDPFLTSRLAVAFCKGLQGDDPKYLKTVATPKHFALHSQETGRTSRSFDVSERALREYYLPAFEACFHEAGAGSTMAAYNGINGVPCTINKWLLTDLLRDEWDFKGAVVTDYISITHLIRQHRAFNNYDDAVAAAINAGIDIMSDTPNVSLAPYVINAVNSGQLSQEVLDRSLSRSLLLRFRLGMFDPPDKVPFARMPPTTVGSPEHMNLALQTAREATVLLQNNPAPKGYGFDRLLPIDLRRISSIALIGPYASIRQLGTYPGVPANASPAPLAAIRDAVGDRVLVRTADYGDIDACIRAAAASDIVIVVAGLNNSIENEGVDRSSLDLPVDHRLFLDRIRNANPLTILVLEGGSPIGLEWAKANFPAILMIWYPGEQGSNALADVLLGDYNPAGRLPITFYRSVNDLPPLDDYEITKGRTYMYLKNPATFPFGYGLSYTSFSYANLQLRTLPAASGSGPSFTATFDVTNTGSLDGDEVPQLYVHMVQSAVTRPLKQLKGFQRITIPKGQTRSITFSVPASELTYWDTKTHKFVFEPGAFEVLVGASSEDIRLRGTADLK